MQPQGVGIYRRRRRPRKPPSPLLKPLLPNPLLKPFVPNPVNGSNPPLKPAEALEWNPRMGPLTVVEGITVESDRQNRRANDGRVHDFVRSTKM